METTTLVGDLRPDNPKRKARKGGQWKRPSRIKKIVQIRHVWQRSQVSKRNCLPVFESSKQKRVGGKCNTHSARQEWFVIQDIQGISRRVLQGLRRYCQGLRRYDQVWQFQTSHNSINKSSPPCWCKIHAGDMVGLLEDIIKCYLVLTASRQQTWSSNVWFTKRRRPPRRKGKTPPRWHQTQTRSSIRHQTSDKNNSKQDNKTRVLSCIFLFFISRRTCLFFFKNEHQQCHHKQQRVCCN